MAIRINRRATVGLAVATLVLALLTPVSYARKGFDGQWVLTLTVPDAPGSNNNQTLVLNLDASSRGNSLHGRVTITDASNRVFGGVWRQAGKKVSITFEMPCEAGEQCASLVLLGVMKEGKTKLKKGDVIVMWDTPNDDDPSQFDTSRGSFSGERSQ